MSLALPLRARSSGPLASLALAALLALNSPQAAQAGPIEVLGAITGQYNVFVLGNMGSQASPYTSDSQGPMAVGGNLYLMDFTTASNTTNGGPALIVGGNMMETRGTIRGNAYIGGNANFTTNSGGTTVQGNLNVRGSLISAPTQVTGTTLVGVAAPALPLNFASVGADLISASALLASSSYTSLGVAGTVLQNGHQLTLTGAGTGLNVFTLTAAQVANLGSGSLTFNLPSSATALINVSGQSVSVGSPGNFGFFFNGIDEDQVLFNFYEATTLAIQSFNGSILAPLAAVSFTNGQLNGSLVAGSVRSTVYQNGEFHYDPFEGRLPSGTANLAGDPVAVPEPATLLLHAGAVLLFVGFRRRRGAVLSR
jgi:choice-of-anchor A domain-containing protein